jgi:hypothetical protein
VATAIGQGRFRLAGEAPQSLAALARSGGGGLLMGYGLLMVAGGVLAGLERRQAHQQLVTALADGLVSGVEPSGGLGRYAAFGLTAWLEPDGAADRHGPQLLHNGDQSWLQSRTAVRPAGEALQTLVVRQNVTASIARQRTLLLLATGTPMLAMGDELGRSQQGNNNAYCQDNALSWIDWQRADAGLIEFTARLVALRHALPALRLDRWLADGNGGGPAEARWLAPEAAAWREMTVADWHDGTRHALGLWLTPPDADAALLWFNPEPQPLRCALPPGPWRWLLDSSQIAADANAAISPVVTGAIDVPAQSVLLLTPAAIPA